ncbi:hypothetical protein GCM10011409_34520 [Lentibacillus populi]|uniref:Uncharacterized protein n=1 Tax=Lentibacillus populi TaxID=1827502 RepID=A0A9W5U0M6_9BACI|nr:hypothetical protein GCM10011409_34520 [Lentibacillus populi]
MAENLPKVEQTFILDTFHGILVENLVVRRAYRLSRTDSLSGHMDEGFLFL